MFVSALCCFFFFFNDTATTEIYTLSLHDALPIYQMAATPAPSGWLSPPRTADQAMARGRLPRAMYRGRAREKPSRSEEHTSELQSRLHLVCRLLLEKKKKNKNW